MNHVYIYKDNPFIYITITNVEDEDGAMETKVTRCPAEQLKTKLNYEGLFYVNPVGIGGGLTFLWKIKKSVSLLSYSVNHVDLSITFLNMTLWHLIGFYECSEWNRRHVSRNILRSLKDRSSMPWYIIDVL